MKIWDSEPMKESALSKIQIQQAVAHYGRQFEKFIDYLYDDDDCDDVEETSSLPDQLIFKNPYTEQQITSAVRLFSEFYLTNKLLQSYTINKVVSTLDLLYVEIVIKVADKDFDVKVNYKF